MRLSAIYVYTVYSSIATNECDAYSNSLNILTVLVHVLCTAAVIHRVPVIPKVLDVEITTQYSVGTFLLVQLHTYSSSSAVPTVLLLEYSGLLPTLLALSKSQDTHTGRFGGVLLNCEL